jgi:hypothetical protein
MNLLNNFHLQSASIGAAGFTLAQVTPGNPADLLHLAIVAITAVIQIIHLLKKNKNQNP